ncbi:hypothetical protein J3A83DRAFT_4368952 [Scleroderma citrinum]
MLKKTIVVMGPTGVGKSSFIRNAVSEGTSTDIQVGHHLHSETSQVQSIHLLTQNGLGINLVDTPGFDDSREGVTDADILSMIAMFLTTQFREGTSQITGFIYLHRISDTRVGGTSKRNIRIFQKLCGQDSLKNVVIVTTMWDKVTPEEGLQREQELMLSDNLFKPLLDGGAVMTRHDGTQQSAHDVIKHLFKLESTVPQIVRELVIGRRNLLDTEAGMELQKEVRDVLQRHQQDLQRLEDEIREAIQQRDKRTEIEVVLDRRKVEGDIAKLHGELKKLENSTGTMDIRGRATVQRKGNTQHATTGQSTSIGGGGSVPANEQKELDKTNKIRSSSLPVTTGGNFGYANAHTKGKCATQSNSQPPVPLQECSSTRSGINITTQREGNYRPYAWGGPEIEPILNNLERLSFVKRTQLKTIPADNAIIRSINYRITDFAIAVVCGVERARSALAEAQSIQSSRTAHDLYQFADELQRALTKIQEDLSRAQQEMKDVTRPGGHRKRTFWNLAGLLSRTTKYPIGRAGARPHTSDEIIQVAGEIIANMGCLVDRWTWLTKIVSQLKEHILTTSSGFHNKIVGSLELIIRELNFYNEVTLGV